MHQNGFTTTILHSDRKQSVEHGAVHKPMHPSSEFAYEDARELAAVFQGKAGFTYARQGTPTTTALEAKINQMEGGKGTVSFATGMAALAAIFTTLLRRGDHLVSSQFVFGNTNSLLGTLLELAWRSPSWTQPIRRRCARRSSPTPAWFSPKPSPTRARKLLTWP